MATTAFEDVKLVAPIILPLGKIHFVAVRRNGDVALADMLTVSDSKEETRMLVDIQEEKSPTWRDNYPVVTIAAFRLADGFLPAETA